MKTDTIADMLNKMAGDICDNYCKWPEQYENEQDEEDAALYEDHCWACPLNVLGV